MQHCVADNERERERLMSVMQFDDKAARVIRHDKNKQHYCVVFAGVICGKSPAYRLDCIECRSLQIFSRLFALMVTVFSEMQKLPVKLVDIR